MERMEWNRQNQKGGGKIASKKGKRKTQENIKESDGKMAREQKEQTLNLSASNATVVRCS
jgi:hypothetical protein